MAVIEPGVKAGIKVERGTLRKLKTHTKSRKGCGNCKLRKVKCDERILSCKKCESYGIICDYESRNSNLQSSARGSGNVQLLKKTIYTESQTILSLINEVKGATSLGSSPSSSSSFNDQYLFSIRDLEVLYRFHSRTLLTIGPPQIRSEYQRIYTTLTYSHVFLLHTVMTLTLMHDQYLGIGSSIENATAIAYHWSRAASLLNERLTAGVEPTERDALWASAALLGALAFSSVEASTPEDVWPLHPASNLDWLRLTEGKKEIWKIAEPTRPDSVFQPIMGDFIQYASPNAASMAELQRLPGALFGMCDFDDTSLDPDNPYYGPASLLAQTIDIECTKENVGRFLSFFGCMTTQYKQLLTQKDPCAMIILGYWYSKMCHGKQWYLWRRAYLESQAICKYLLQTYDHDIDIVASTRDIQIKCAAEKPWSPECQMQTTVKTLRPIPGYAVRET